MNKMIKTDSTINNSTQQQTTRWRPYWFISGMLLLGWLFFSYGSLAQYIAMLEKDPLLKYWIAALLAGSSPVVLIALGSLLWFKRHTWYPRLMQLLERHTDTIDSLSEARIGLWIVLAAALSLYAELMIIRLHSSFFQLFAHFKNVSLLSCFLGLGIGYARGYKRPLATPLVFPLIAFQIIFMYALRQFFPDATYYLQNPIPEQIAFGLKQVQGISQSVTVYGFLIMTFAFNALCFIPLGQLVSRIMTRQQSLIAYSWNLLGSLAGIGLFNVLAFLWTPPAVWLSVAILMFIAFLYKQIKSLIPTAIAAIIVLASLSWSPHQTELDVYSPYQLITLHVGRFSSPFYLSVSNTYYQRILDLSEENLQYHENLRPWSAHYSLPYYFKSVPEDVLVVGSGTGNDVAAAIRHGTGEIDAVEIDPVVLHFGKELHPEAPYQADSVNAIVDDARAYLRKTDKQYDLIVYGLLDSHTLLSGKGGVRLDSYVYTVEAFREARAKLKPDGLICLTFAVTGPELGRKLFLMLQEAFDGKSPLVYQTGYDQGYGFLIGEQLPSHSELEATHVTDITDRFATSDIRADISTDDWPFFYMPVRKYPISYVIMILVLLVISIIFIRQLLPDSKKGFSSVCFFLGAGFMLIETKGITELALVYGSTWIVVGIVIAAILLMAFGANLLVMKFGTLRPWKNYGLLFLAVIAGMAISSFNLSTSHLWFHRILMTLLLTLPLFFSGIAFSSELKKSASIPVALSSNLLGAILGGFLEYNSMYFGYQSLYLLALFLYGLAFWGAMRSEK